MIIWYLVFMVYVELTEEDIDFIQDHDAEDEDY